MKLIQQTFYNLRRQPVIAAVTIIGTALSIFLVMVVVMMQQVKVAPFAPESNRDRFLHYSFVSFGFKEWGNVEENNSNCPMSFRMVKELFYPLETPEAVTAYTIDAGVMSVGLAKQKPFAADVRETDHNYFNVFDFSFVAGTPFGKTDFEAGLSKAVIDSNVANRLFGTTDVVGREFLLNNAVYTVAGVVKPVSPIATKAYAQVWINTTSTNTPDNTWALPAGYYSVTILAPEGRMDEVREEFNVRFAQYQKEIGREGYEILNRHRPYDQETQATSFSANNEPDVKGARRQRWVIFAILLIVPAINLSSMTHSRLRQRISELAVRRAFGATRLNTLLSIINENFVITLIGGILGLILSVVMAFCFNRLIFAQDFTLFLTPPSVNPSMLLQWSTFGWALLFCFVLNLLSSAIPAIQMSRVSLVTALRGGK